MSSTSWLSQTGCLATGLLLWLHHGEVQAAQEQNAVAAFHEAWEAAASDELELALESVDRALKAREDLGPRKAAALEVRADVLRQLGRYGPALEDVRESRLLFPEESAELDQIYPGLAGFLSHEIPTLEAQLWIENGLPDLARPLVEELAQDCWREASDWDAPAFSNLVRTALNLELAVDDHRALLRQFEVALEDPRALELTREDPGAWAVRVGMALTVARRMGHEVPCEPAAFLASLVDDGLLPEESAGVFAGSELAHSVLQLEDAERELATLWLTTALLDAGQPGAAAERLARFEGDRSSPEVLTRLARSARENGAEPAELERLAAELQGSWEEIFQLARDAPIETGGLGLFLAGERREVFSEWMALQAELTPRNGEPDASPWLAPLLELHGLGTLARSEQLAPVNGDQLKTLLSPEDLALFFAAGRTMSWVLAADRDRVTAHRLPSDHLLQKQRRELIGALHELLGDPGGERSAERMESAADRFTKSLLPEDLQARIGEQGRLVIAAGEELGDLALPFLHGPTGRPLGLTHSIISWPSPAVALHAQVRRRQESENRESRGSARPLIAGFLGEAGDGEISQVAGLVHLDLTEASLRKDLGLSSSAELQILADNAATSANVLDALQTEPALACLLFHGRVDPSRPLSGRALVCAPQRASGGAEALPPTWLASEAILGGNRFANVVVVLSCGAHRSPQRRGDDGAFGLANTMLLRGAECVVASSYPLPYPGTTRFAASLFEALRNQPDQDLGDALLQVRQNQAASNSGIGNLAVSFAFQAIGLGDARVPAGALGPRPSQPRDTWSWVLAGLALVVGGGFIFLKRRPSS